MEETHANVTARMVLYATDIFNFSSAAFAENAVQHVF